MHNICCQQKLTNIYQNEACLWEDDVLYTSASYVTHVTSRVLHAVMSRVLRVFRARYFHQQ